MNIIHMKAEEWKDYAENAHVICFNEKRPASMDRIDFALMAVENGSPQAYCTVRELDSESVYWQYGGAFPSSRNTINSFKSYSMFRNSIKELGYKRISTYIKNDNFVMLRMAFKIGYKIIGIRIFGSEIFVELLNDLETEAC